MADIKQVSQRFAVAPQIALGDIPAISSMGYRHIINNRPDGEEPDQPTSEEIEAAARKEGMTYVHAPFVGPPTAEAVKAASPLFEHYRKSAPILMQMSYARNNSDLEGDRLQRSLLRNLRDAGTRGVDELELMEATILDHERFEKAMTTLTFMGMARRETDPENGKTKVYIIER